VPTAALFEPAGERETSSESLRAPNLQRIVEGAHAAANSRRAHPGENREELFVGQPCGVTRYLSGADLELKAADGLSAYASNGGRVASSRGA
jgi:hypothetical protein